MTYNIPNSNGETFRNNISADLNTLDDSAVHKIGDETITGVKTFSSVITSNIVTGTPPLQVASTTKVDNLNSDTVGGYRIWKGDQAAYDAIAVKDPNTVYFIND